MHKLPNVGHEFKDESLLLRALTHTSYTNERRDYHLENYERLEFLGDAILGMLCGEYVYMQFPAMSEGDLTRLRASIVCEKSLLIFARRLNLGDYMVLGNGEIATGGRQRASVLADMVEAILAAIYLDGGIECAKEFIMPYIIEKANETVSLEHPLDYKTELQEIIQKSRQETLTYRVVNETGPDHNKCYTVELLINSNVIASGVGRSKKSAEQDAARLALELMGE